MDLGHLWTRRLWLKPPAYVAGRGLDLHKATTQALQVGVNKWTQLVGGLRRLKGFRCFAPG